MTKSVDLTNHPSKELREQLFEVLDDLDHGEELTVTAEHDPSPVFALYQLQKGRELDWDTEEIDPKPTVRVESVGKVDESIEFDVRSIPPRRRHELLTDAFDALNPDQEFILVNDHDPKPLYYEFRSTRGDVVSWEYESKDDDKWRVIVGKTAPATEEYDDVITAFDVRKIPKQERHPAIHHRYGTIPEGATMEIIAPHEPRPLHREFRQRYGDTFEWQVVESESGRCRVHITKTEAIDEGKAEPTDGHGCGHHGHNHGSSHDDTHAHGSEKDADESIDDTDRSAELTVTDELDVRDLPPAQRHKKIFSTYADLDDGEAFVLVNDHDPKPLYHQFEAETGEEFHWEYQLKDPGEFRVRIGRSPNTDSGASLESKEGFDVSSDEQPEAPF